MLWTNVIADFVIGFSYVAISATLVWLVRRAGRDLPYTGFFWAFGLFIVSCGATHFMEIVTVWRPVYWLSAAVKLVTAAASAGTAIALFAGGERIVEFAQAAKESAKLRGNESFRAMIQSAPVGVVSADLQERVTVWNPAAERMFGWALAEILGQQIPIIPPEKEHERGELRDKALEGKVTEGFETVRLKRSGERLSVSLSMAPIRDENGVLRGVMSILEDISERKRFELELQEKTVVLSTVTRALNHFLDSGNWSAASQHLLAFAISQTKSDYGFLGVILDGLILRVLAQDGTVWDIKLNPDLAEEKIPHPSESGLSEFMSLSSLLGKVIEKGETIAANGLEVDSGSGGLPAGYASMHSFLGVPIFKEGVTVGILSVANCAGGYSGQELQYLETMCEATGALYENYRQSLRRKSLEDEQKRLDTQVRQAQKMEVLGRLAGGVAHDFNNMLMILGGCSELLDRALPDGSPARQYLGQIQRTTEKAAAITKQLLVFSRKQVVEFRPMDLHAALTESQFMLPRLLGSDVALTYHCNAASSWIHSDPSQIEQVVANLAINSRDAMPEGGSLSISTRNATQLPEDAADVPSSAADWVVLEVADTGFGMDEKTRAQIFEPFFTTKCAGKGTGLGLATVYGIVKQSNGIIRVDTAPGKGTRFEIYFPVCPTPVFEPQHPSLVSPEGGNGNGETILVADDEPALRQALVEFLQTSGYKVLHAQTATEALEMAQKNPGNIDVLLTDVVMPGLRGPELARRVTATHPEIRVIYMSGYAEGFSEAQLPESSTFLQKPFRFATLLEQLKLIRGRV